MGEVIADDNGKNSGGGNTEDGRNTEPASGGNGGSSHDNGSQSGKPASGGGRPSLEGIRLISGGQTTIKGQGGQKSSKVVSGELKEKTSGVSAIPNLTQPPKKGKPRGKSKKADSTATHTEGAAMMIAGLLGTVSGVASMRVGAHWALSQDECQNIAKPLANILAKYDLTEKMSEYGDWTALIIALAIAVAPKVMISMQMKPKKEVKNNVQSIRKPEQQTEPANGNTGTGSGNDQHADQGYAADGYGSTKSFLAASMG